MRLWRALLVAVVLVCPRRGRASCGDGYNTSCHGVQRRSLFVQKTACYGDLGCFSSGPPFYHPIYRPLSSTPQAPEVIKTMFMLFTRRNRNRPIIIHPHRPKAIRKSTFDRAAISRVIIHGLNDNLAINSWFYRMKDVLLDRADENVFILDWSGSNRLPYTIAVANARLVGAQLAQFIQFLYKTEGTSPESFHLIGHSLGAHVAGYAGERLHKLGRITGLDPAGPFFRNVPANVRLDPADAVFVDVLHTDPGVSILQGFGTPEDCGDLDFYPGGGDPPGCEQTVARSFSEDLPTEAIGNLISCQHFRAHEFFIYSFNQEGCLFVGAECPSWEQFLKGQCNCGPEGKACALMGIFAPTYTFPDGKHYADRRLYLKVGPERPYCLHQYQLVVHLHSLGNYKSYAVESADLEVAIVGDHERMKVKLLLDINLLETKQVVKYLLTADRPLGSSKSADLTMKVPAAELKHHSVHLKSDTIIDRIEINYLFPLPKSHTSTLLCRASDEFTTHGARTFFLTSSACY